MKIVVVTCLWKREEVARLMLDNLQWRKEQVAKEGIEVEVLACGSEGAKSAVIARTHGAHYMESENQPLGRKFNSVLLGAQGFCPDAVMVLGSDNLVNAEVFRAWAKLIEAGKEYLGFLDGYMFDTVTHRLIQWHGYKRALRRGEPLGSGRCYSRALLDRAEWRLWDSRKRNSLDWSVTQRMKHLKPKTCFGPMESWGIRHLGLKTPENICSFRNLLANSAKNISDIDNEMLAEWWGAEAEKRIFSLTPTSTVQELPGITDHPKRPRSKSLRDRIQIELHDKVMCPRCMAVINREVAIIQGAKLGPEEKFICRQCAIKEQENVDAKRGGGVPEASDLVSRVPHESGGDGGGGALPEGGEAAEGDGGCATEGADGSPADFPEDFVDGLNDLGRSE